MVQMHGKRFGIRRDSRQPGTRGPPGERNDRLDLRIIGKSPGVRQVDRRARGIGIEVSLLTARQSCGNAVRIANQKIGGVNENGPVALGEYLESPDNGTRKRFFDGILLVRVVSQGPVVEIVLDQQQLRPGTLKLDDPGRTELTAVQAEVVGADTASQRRLVKKRLTQLVGVDQQPPFPLIPVQIVIAGQVLVAVEFTEDIDRFACRQLVARRDGK